MHTYTLRALRTLYLLPKSTHALFAPKNVLAWLAAGGATVDGLAVRANGDGGSVGLFATRRFETGEILLLIPQVRCVRGMCLERACWGKPGAWLHPPCPSLIQTRPS